MKRPIARPGAGNPRTQNPRQTRDISTFSSPNVPAHTPPHSYLTASRLNWLARQLSDRDWQLLEFVGACRLASGPQLVQHFWDTTNRDSAAARAGRRTLKRLVDWRVLDPLPRRVGSLAAGSESLVYGVGRAGTRLLARRGYRVRTGFPGALYLDHTLACTQVTVDLDQAHGTGKLELIAPPEPEPACWRRFVGATGESVTLKPDLFVRVAAGADKSAEDRWFIEVDRATESSATVKRKALVHLSYWRSGAEPVHPRVLWVVPDERRVIQLCEVLVGLPEEARRLFSVCLTTETVDFLSAEADS